MPAGSGTLFNALVRTHHIKSRKKVSKLKEAAEVCACFVLIRSGSPGIMYVEGEKEGVRQWVDVVHSLRYKDYQLLSRPAKVCQSEDSGVLIGSSGLREVDAVKVFGAKMQQRGLWTWWRQAMGYTSK